MAYKAINTLDSTVGYKNEKYLHIGFASAKIDDIANYIPARIGSIINVYLVVWLLGYNYKNASRLESEIEKIIKVLTVLFQKVQ